MGKFMQRLIQAQPHVSENQRLLTTIINLEKACLLLDALHLRIRSYETKSTPMPIIEIDYDPAVERLPGQRLQGAHWYAIVHDCRVEWVHRDTTIRSVP